MKTVYGLQQKKSLKSKICREFGQNKYLYLLSVPIFLYFIIFCYGPMFGLVIAFKQYEIGSGILHSKWVGLRYFKEFFQGIYFARTMKNTLIISFYDLIFGFPLPIVFALLLNEIQSGAFKKSVQTITYLPHFVSMVVICGIIVDFFGTDGVVTKMLTLFGMENKNYVGSSGAFRSIYVITNIWQELGWNSIIYFAALTGVDACLYEAATIDGAGKFRQVISITIPSILPTIMTMLILRIGQLLSVGYEKIILLYSSATYDVADVIASYVYRMGVASNRFSYSAAVGLFQSVVNIVLLFIANRFSKSATDTSLF